MNTHILLLSPAEAFASAPALTSKLNLDSIRRAAIKNLASKLDFRPITHADMSKIWSILKSAPGRTTDFSYGGLLMWVEFFNYEFAIVNDTLFIKGKVEDNLEKPAFSVPVGLLPLDTSIEMLKEYCREHQMVLEFSAVPEECVEEFRRSGAKEISLLEDWSDYLYSANSLATLSGKKYGKKRNHVNQFLTAYPDWDFQPLTAFNIELARAFMNDVDAEGDQTEMAIAERQLNRSVLDIVEEGDEVLEGGILTDGHGRILGFTIGDVKGDTLYVHIEKSLRDVPGGFEMLNKTFAADMKEKYPQIEYINREDDAGDPGLRRAKESYHPVELLKKYNVIF